MFVTEAIMRLVQIQFAHYHEVAEWSNHQQITKLVEEIAEDLQNYHQLFHSIRWNRARKKTKADLENKLLALANHAYEKINLLGSLLNQQAQENVKDIIRFNQLVQKIQEAKMLVEINHLNQQVTPIYLKSPPVTNPNCIPGLENY